MELSRQVDVSGGDWWNVRVKIKVSMSLIELIYDQSVLIMDNCYLIYSTVNVLDQLRF